MAKKLDFKDFLTVDYAPGMPDLIKRNAKKRKSGDTETSAVGEAKKPVAPQDLPPASGKHDPGVGMGWAGKHKVIKDKPSKKHVHVFQYESVEEDNLEEALTPSQRRQRARIMKRLAPKIAIGRKRAERRFADPERLKNRARKAARKAILLKLTKDVPKDELTYARRQEIEKRLDTPQMKKRIDRLAVRMLPKVRKKEIERHRGQQSAD
jgi:hypothetical protein